MKVEVFCEDKVPEPVVRLKLVQEGLDVTVCAVSERGEPLGGGRLITFYPSGIVYTHTSVSSKLGLPLDEDGCLKIS